jgi:DNA polymerase III epsilon subunit-like protein
MEFGNLVKSPVSSASNSSINSTTISSVNTYGNTSVISFIEGKNVFIFDTETTGLPDKVPGSQWGTPNEYWPYNMNDKYKRSRIVSIAWVYVQSFDKSILEGEIKSIQHFIRYPEGFDDIPTTHIHGISFETALNSGIPFNDIFENCGLYDKLINSNYIIAHNIMFDIHILLNELFRLGTEKAYEVIRHIKSLLDSGKCICSGELGKDICKLEYKSKTTKTSTYINNDFEKITDGIIFPIEYCEISDHSENSSDRSDPNNLLNCIKYLNLVDKIPKQYQSNIEMFLKYIHNTHDTPDNLPINIVSNIITNVKLSNIIKKTPETKLTNKNGQLQKQVLYQLTKNDFQLQYIYYSGETNKTLVYCHILNNINVIKNVDTNGIYCDSSGNIYKINNNNIAYKIYSGNDIFVYKNIAEYNQINRKKHKKYKMPKLSELYNHFYKCDFEDAHSANGDVKALMKCLMKM